MDLSKIKKLYNSGVNITQYLSKKYDISKSIEISYDLQSGTYSKGCLNNKKMKAYVSEISNILNVYIKDNDNILDCGTGEMTTITHIANLIFTPKNKVFCFDISLSRMLWGGDYNHHFIKDSLSNIFNPFVGELDNIPILNKSVDITWTSHAIEPNHTREESILKEIFRVTKRRVILFEPSYENNTKLGKNRMEKLGYVRNLPNHIVNMGGEIEKIIKIKNTMNPINPTYAYIIIPPKINKNNKKEEEIFMCPINKTKLLKYQDCFFSSESLLAYPVISSIPILRKKYAIVASHYETHLNDFQKILKSKIK